MRRVALLVLVVVVLVAHKPIARFIAGSARRAAQEDLKDPKLVNGFRERCEKNPAERERNENLLHGETPPGDALLDSRDEADETGTGNEQQPGRGHEQRSGAAPRQGDGVREPGPDRPWPAEHGTALTVAGILLLVGGAVGLLHCLLRARGRVPPHRSGGNRRAPPRRFVSKR